MKVLFVNEFEHFGGAEVHIAGLRLALEARGHSTALIAQWADASRGKPGGDYLQLTNALEKFQPDVIHFHNVGAKVHDLAWAIGTGFPHVLSLHDYWPWCPLRNAMMGSHVCQQPCGESCFASRRGGALAKELAQAAGPKVVFNPYSAQLNALHGIDCQVIPHGVDSVAYQPASQKSTRALFISAKARNPAKGEAYYDAVIGSDIALSLKLIDVPAKDVCFELGRNLFFLHTGMFEETFCLAIAEAMASGCCVISFDVAGARAILGPDRGILVKRGDVIDMRWQWMEMLHHPERAVALGRAARKYIMEHHRPEDMAAAYEGLYSSVLAREEVKVG